MEKKTSIGAGQSLKAVDLLSFGNPRIWWIGLLRGSGSRFQLALA
jgi:hypothetical protein